MTLQLEGKIRGRPFAVRRAPDQEATAFVCLTCHQETKPARAAFERHTCKAEERPARRAAKAEPTLAEVSNATN